MFLETLLVASLSLLAGLVLYHHAVYPALMRLVARLLRVGESPAPGGTLP